MSYPRFRTARAHKKVTRTSGNITLNGAATGTWYDLPTNPGDIVLAAQVGDDIEIGVSLLLAALGGGASGNATKLTAATIVSGAAVNQGPTGGTGAASHPGHWWTPQDRTVGVGGSYLYTIQSGDLDASGFVTLRLRYLQDATGAQTIYASSNAPLEWWAKNLGPADPN